MRFFILFLLALFFVACSSEDVNSTVDTTTDTNLVDDIPDALVIKTNTKSIYYKNDFLNDANLSVDEQNIAIYSVDNTTDLNESIPFVIDLEGDYEFCSDGAQNILSLEIIDDVGTSIFSDAPKFSLNCISIHLTPKKYILKLSYIMKIVSIYGVEVPYIRLFEKREIMSDLTISDWENGKLYESTQGTQYGNFFGYRYCYKTPINEKSYMSFWRDSNKFTLSFRTSLDDGTVFNCTYPGGKGSQQFPSSASDIGDIDTIIADLLFTQSQSSLIYSRPSSGSTSIDLDTSINIEFRGSIDRLSLNEAFSITPNISGSLSLNGNILTFVPDDELSLLTKYRVQLKGLSDNNIVIPDINFSFITHDSYSYDDSKSSLSNYELCAVGISRYCASDNFATISNIDIDFLDNAVHGSRTLKVKTTLDKVTPVNILIDYELIDVNNTTKFPSGTLLIKAGTMSSVNEISFNAIHFNIAEQNATLSFSNIRNVHLTSDYNFEYIVSRGEFFNSHSEVIAPEVVEINEMYFTDDTKKNKILTIKLNDVAREDIDINLEFIGSNKTVTSCKAGLNCSSLPLYEPRYIMVIIKEGTSRLDIDFTFSTNEDAYVYSMDFEANLYRVRNASILNGLHTNVHFAVDTTN